MSTAHRILLFVVCWTLWLAESAAAQTVETLSDRIREVPGTVLVANDLKVVRDDLQRLFKDVGFGVFVSDIEEVFPIPSDSGIASSAGVLLYIDAGVFGRQVIEFVLDDRDQLLKSLDHDIEQKDDEWFEPRDSIEDIVPLPDLLWQFYGGHHVMVNESRLFMAPAEAKAEAKTIRDAPRLSEKLDEAGRRIIDQSGLTLVGFFDNAILGDVEDMQPMMRAYSEKLTEAEMQWIKDFADVAYSADIGILGLKYHTSKQLEFRAQATIGDDKSFAKLVNLQKVDRQWQPALGLEPDQLVAAGGIQLDAFLSSAAPRAFPQLLVGEFGRGEALQFLQGNMLRVLLELAGDSWNELDAARLALYQNDGSEKAGELAIIGVLDASDVGSVMTELRLLSSITNPMMAAERTEQRNEEIQRLIKDLADDDSNVSSRAETRLRLAGPVVIPELEQAVQKGDTRLQRRAERVLAAARREKNRADDRSGVANPWFWTTLNPGLELFEATGKVGNFDSHHVEITPDPSKNEKEVEEAIAVMSGLFGSQWNQVRFVQVGNRFVFMLGSDNDLLEKVVANVEAVRSPVRKQFEGVGHGPQQGQLQFFFDTNRLANMLDFGYLPDDQEIDGKLSWAGLDFSERKIAADALVPIKQVIPFLFGIGG